MEPATDKPHTSDNLGAPDPAPNPSSQPSREDEPVEADLGSPDFPSVDETWEEDGADSALGGMSIADSTSSLRSSIYENVEENGFTYHGYKKGKYPLPNDVREQERLEIQHTLWGVTLRGKQYLAPIKEPKRVLDIGTGTGIWAIEFASAHPSANVIGTDLSAIQPLYVPPNCHFQIDDAEDEWTFTTKFDYIHGRALVSCFSDPSFVIRQAFHALDPGGYLELNDAVFPIEFIGDVPTESHLYRWSQYGVEAAQKIGRPLTNVQHYARWMREAGFEDVQEKVFYWCTSPWPKGKYLKEVALYFQADMLSGLEGISMKLFTLALGWKPEDVKVFVEGVRKDFLDINVHGYLPIRVVYGRKPAQ